MRTLFGIVAALAAGCALAAPAPADPAQVLWDRLREDVAAVEHRLDGVLGVAIKDLSSGQELLVRPDAVFPQASSIKIAVLAELYRQSEQAARGRPGQATLADRYVVRAEDVVADSDILGGLTPGVTQLTLRDLATMMVAVSDNGATNVLIDRVGMGNVNAMLDGLGLAHTRLQRKMMDLAAARAGRENVSTPREMMQLLERLYRGQVVGEPLRGDFFAMLATHKDSWLPRELPDDLRIANKPGALEGVRNDSGIVFVEGRPYVICVMTSFLASERAGEEAISAISAAAYRLFDRLARASALGRVISPANSSRH
ncbi:MAG: serine hydrolase [Proteobacteria bacterium]|nr:serine hydrolase [Pseudomonadota bacterium]